jgi:predicted nuclease of predicted toxin-antitoxin system
VKVLFDHNVPFGLRKALAEHEVALADEMGWAKVGNGELLRSAEDAGFEVMLTCDQNLVYQQNMTKRQISLVILNTNNWKLLQRNLRMIVEAVGSAERGSFQFLDIRRRSS